MCAIVDAVENQLWHYLLGMDFEWNQRLGILRNRFEQGIDCSLPRLWLVSETKDWGSRERGSFEENFDDSLPGLSETTSFGFGNWDSFEEAFDDSVPGLWVKQRIVYLGIETNLRRPLMIWNIILNCEWNNELWTWELGQFWRWPSWTPAAAAPSSPRPSSSASPPPSSTASPLLSSSGGSLRLRVGVLTSTEFVHRRNRLSKSKPVSDNDKSPTNAIYERDAIKHVLNLEAGRWEVGGGSNSFDSHRVNVKCSHGDHHHHQC